MTCYNRVCVARFQGMGSSDNIWGEITPLLEVITPLIPIFVRPFMPFIGVISLFAQGRKGYLVVKGIKGDEKLHTVV